MFAFNYKISSQSSAVNIAYITVQYSEVKLDNTASTATSKCNVVHVVVHEQYASSNENSLREHAVNLTKDVHFLSKLLRCPSLLDARRTRSHKTCYYLYT